MDKVFAYFLNCLTKNYRNFEGCASRAEYWSYLFIWLLIAIPIFLVSKPLYIIWELATFFPGLSVGVRRMHDVNQSGWMLLLCLVPVIGWFIVLVFLLLPSSKNKYNTIMEKPINVVGEVVHRPWGSYQSLEESPGFQVKKIIVKPGQKLSLQYHHQRAEHWVIVAGIADVQIHEEIHRGKVGDTFFIPIEAKHRLSNPGDSDLTIIEVQQGEYLGEDDIVRLEDNYGRVD